VLVVGAGGLGSPLILYLAAAGIGQIGIIDSDRVSLDNLQRQIVHDTNSVGRSKTKSAAAAIERLNPHVETRLYTTRLVPENALDIVRGFDIVADGSDNFATRYLVNDACYFAKRPLVFAAVGPFDGHLTTFRAFETDGEGNPRPSYRCLFPEPPPDGTVAPCSEAGILGAVAGVIGCLAAVEMIKELLGLGESLVGRLLLYDALAARFTTVTYAWDPESPLNGQAPCFHDLSHHRTAMAEVSG
jgi:adenylyltransferase/sulfurtransferase